MKTAEVMALLAARYSPPERAFIPEFRCGTGYSRDSRADALAMGLWPSAKGGLEITGFEVKTSRADWLRELKNPYKSTPVKQFCDRWYLVVGDLKVITYATELPDGWGLMFQENGELHTMIEAPKLEPIPLDRAFIAALMRRATRVDGLPHIVPPNLDYKPKAAAA